MAQQGKNPMLSKLPRGMTKSLLLHNTKPSHMTVLAAEFHVVIAAERHN